MEVDRRRARLPAQDDQRGSLSRSDGESGRLIDEILVAAESSLGVTRQAVDGLLLLTHRSRHREIAVGEWNADRRADADRPIEQAQEESNREDNEDGSTAGTASTGASSKSSPTIAVPGHIRQRIPQGYLLDRKILAPENIAITISRHGEEERFG